MTNFDPRRQAIIAEAETWLGTPFHDKAAVKGAGVDCLYLIYSVYHAAGIVGEAEIPFYRLDACLHRDEETYLNSLLEHGREVAQPLMGDVALWKMGRLYWHGTIVAEWPSRIIHAFAEKGEVCESDAQQAWFRGRPVKFIRAFCFPD